MKQVCGCIPSLAVAVCWGGGFWRGGLPRGVGVSALGCLQGRASASGPREMEMSASGARGVSTPGPRDGDCSQSQGMSGPGPGGCIPACTGADTSPLREQNDCQTGVKTLHFCNFICG